MAFQQNDNATVHVHRSDGLIIPDKIPGDDLNQEQIHAAVTSLVSSATAIRASTEEVTTSWSALPVSFVAPGAEVVHAAMTPASASAAVFAGKLDRVARALTEFNDQIGPLKRTFASIKADAIAFTNEIGHDGLVWVNATETKRYEFDANVTSGGRGYVAAGPGTAVGGTDPVTYLRGKGESARMRGGIAQIYAPWTESGEHVDENNRLLDRVADAYAKLTGLEAECANAINSQRDDCVADVTGIEAWQLKQSGDNTAKLPWGHRVEEDRNCGESAWWGAGNAALGMAQGVGSLAFGYDAARNEFWRGDAYANAWGGAAVGFGSLLLSTMPITPALAALGVPVFKEASENTTAMLKGMIAWDTWQKNPAEAFGATVVNVGTFLIPGAGAAGGVVKGLTVGTKLEAIANAIVKVEAASAKLKTLLPDSLSGLTKPNRIDIESPSGVGLPDAPRGDALAPHAHDGQESWTHTGESGNGGAEAPGTAIGLENPRSVGQPDVDTGHDSAGGTPSDSGQPAQVLDAHAPDGFYDDAVQFADDASAAQYGADHWNDYVENLPDDQKAALTHYTLEPSGPRMPGDPPTYVDINGALRGEGPIPSDVLEEIHLMDKALAGHPTTETIIVTRGTNLNHIPGSPSKMVGLTFEDPAYMSTSVGEAVFTGKEAILHLRIPAGTPGLYLEKVSAFAGTERELLLGRGVTYRVDSVADVNGQWQVYGEVVFDD